MTSSFMSAITSQNLAGTLPAPAAGEKEQSVDDLI